MRARSFLAGFLLCALAAGCAAFKFKYYGLEGVTYREGKLLGPKPEQDLPFSQCEPTAQTKNPCVVMFAKEFFAMKLDYEDTKAKLDRCESGSKGASVAAE